GNSNQYKKGLSSLIVVHLKLNVLSLNVLTDGYEYIPDVTCQQFVLYAKKEVA
ncbi:16143_t:CDS:1, partial [Cetraspora pellucida]